MDILHRYHSPQLDFPVGNTSYRDVAMIPLFKFMYRIRRYGSRFKILKKNSRSAVRWMSQASYAGGGPSDFYTHPPWDLVPNTEYVPLQFEIPYNEAWFYDCRSFVYSTAQVTLPDGAINSEYYYTTAISGDAILSFPTWAVVYDNTP